MHVKSVSYFVVAIISLSAIVQLASCKTNSKQVSGALDQSSADNAKADVDKAVTEVGSTVLTSLVTGLNLLREQTSPFYRELLRDQPDLGIADNPTADFAVLRQSYRQHQLLWQTLVTFAGPDGLLNYDDVLNTLQCIPDSELRNLVRKVLGDKLSVATSYKKVAIARLLDLIETNGRFPPSSNSVDISGLFSEAGRARVIDNLINYKLKTLFLEQCKVDEGVATSQGAFDLIKSHCLQAMEWRAQGILFGVFNLQYGPESRDRKGSSCEGRKLTQENIAKLLETYGTPTTNKREDGLTAVEDFARLQASKYFGPWQAEPTVSTPLKVSGSPLVDSTLGFKLAARLELKGGIPIRLFKKALDGLLGESPENFVDSATKVFSLGQKVEVSRCTQSEIGFVGSKHVRKGLGPQMYESEEELRAYFDPSFLNWQSYLEKKHSNTELRYEISEAKNNRRNAIFSKTDRTYHHQAISGLDFLGHSSVFVEQTFSRIVNSSKIRLENMRLEQEVDGEFVLLVLQADSVGVNETEFSGYAIPTYRSDGSVAEPCVTLSVLPSGGSDGTLPE